MDTKGRLARYGLEHCQTMAQYHALSRNLMHESIAITDKIYIDMEQMERAKLLAGLSSNSTAQPDSDLDSFLKSLSKEDLLRAITIAAEMLAK